MLLFLKIRCHRSYSQISITFAWVKGNVELLCVAVQVLSFLWDLSQQPCKNLLGVSDSDLTGKECSSFIPEFPSLLHDCEVMTRDP